MLSDEERAKVEFDVLRVMTILVDAIDPRISVHRRNDLLDEAKAIDAELTLTLLGSFASGMLGRVAEMVPEKDRDEFIEQYLASTRKNTSEATIMFVKPEDAED